MPTENNVNVKLEVFKEKFTGKLSIIAHFMHSAPNIYKEQEDYIWFPTYEEKKFLSEAFDLTSSGLSKNTQDKKNISNISTQGVKPDVVYNPSGVINPNLNVQRIDPQYTNKETVLQEKQKANYTNDYVKQQQTIPQKNQIYTEETKKENDFKNRFLQNTPTNEKEQTVNNFSNNIKTDDTKKEIYVPDPNYKHKQYDMKKDQQSARRDNNKTDINSAVIAQADLDAIDAALKKHTDKEEHMVQADEKTIVDKVINQKKKWARN